MCKEHFNSILFSGEYTGFHGKTTVLVLLNSRHLEFEKKRLISINQKNKKHEIFKGKRQFLQYMLIKLNI